MDGRGGRNELRILGYTGGEIALQRAKRSDGIAGDWELDTEPPSGVFTSVPYDELLVG